jgi:hypothetical protein
MSTQSQTMIPGNEVKVLRSNATSQALIWIGVGVVLMAIALVIGVDWSTINLPAGMCAAGIFIVFGNLLALPRALRNRSVQVSVSDQGFTYSDSKGQASLQWDQIAAVWQQYVHGSKGRVRLAAYTVQGRDGTKIVLNPNTITKGRDLGLYIQQKTLDALVPAYLNSYHNGQTLGFGPVQLSRAGITVGDKTLPWEHLQSVNASGWLLTINPSGLKAWASLEVSQIPNVRVLLTVIERVGGGAVKISQAAPVTL